MKTPAISTLSKYFHALKKMKKKYVTSDLLSKEIGIYPEIINETLAYFDPIVNLDYQYNLMDLMPQIEEYITNYHANNIKEEVKERVTKRKLDKYESIADFVYQKMSIGGLLDKNKTLTDTELRALKRLINEEQAMRKQLKNKSKK